MRVLSSLSVSNKCLAYATASDSIYAFHLVQMSNTLRTHGTDRDQTTFIPLVTMYNLSFLSQHYGITYKQTRDRMTALGPLLTGFIFQGKGHTKMVTDHGRAVFDRLIQLERSGLSLSSAVGIIKNERGNGNSTATSTLTSNTVESQSIDSQFKEILDQMKSRVSHLESEVHWLRGQLTDAQSQLKALMPPPQIQKKPWWIRVLGR